jgi:hypothetical protein
MDVTSKVRGVNIRIHVPYTEIQTASVCLCTAPESCDHDLRLGKEGGIPDGATATSVVPTPTAGRGHGLEVDGQALFRSSLVATRLSGSPLLSVAPVLHHVRSPRRLGRLPG